MGFGGGAHAGRRVDVRPGPQRVAGCKDNLRLMVFGTTARIEFPLAVAAQVDDGGKAEACDNLQILGRRIAMLAGPVQHAILQPPAISGCITPIIAEIVDAGQVENACCHGGSSKAVVRIIHR
jgi:hypothetical protein